MDQGSKFTLFLPLEYNPTHVKKEKQSSLTISEYRLLTQDSDDSAIQSVPTVKLPETRELDVISEIINETGDDRNMISENDKVVLIIEDDIRFAKIIIEKAHERKHESCSGNRFSLMYSHW
ncbi:MAG: hypothetical protein WDM78_11770 [Puia sp.]